MREITKKQIKDMGVGELEALKLLIDIELDKRNWEDMPRFLTLRATVDYLCKKPNEKNAKIIRNLNKAYEKLLEKIRKKYQNRMKPNLTASSKEI